MIVSAATALKNGLRIGGGYMVKEQVFGDNWLNCEIILMGSDITLIVYGGDTPHVGSVVMAEARPSLTGEGISVTSSVLNRLGHKDEVIARRFAEAVAVRKNCTVACVCGVHINDLTPGQINQTERTADRLLTRVLENLND